jgi:(p)ppGpp synthase/HD superfamily hydrolase
VHVVDVDDDLIQETAIKLFGTIASHYVFIGDSWKNFITQPKPNGFRALIFDIIYPHHPTRNILPQKAEIQILSKNDHIIAQKGANFESIQQRLNLQEQNESVTEFIERILRELETDYIYVYTPKGDIIRLPKGSTVLDFAFKIHTDLGLHCIGARINYKSTKSPFYKLKSGEIIEVLSSKNIEPEFEWLKYVITPKARNAIQNYLKTKESSAHQQKPQYKPIVITDKLPLIVDKYANFKFADCCNPTPDAEAVAIQEENGNIIIHRADCPKLAALATPENVTPVKWAIKDSLYKITLTAMDRIGLLKDIANLISDDLHINMKEIHMKIDDFDKLVIGQVVVKVHHNGKSENCFDKKGCSPQDIKTLTEKIKQIEGIIEVTVQMQL